MATTDEIATKRVALTPGTWATLSNLRKPGQTFDNTIAELITENQRLRLIADLDTIDATEKTVPWEKAKKKLGLA
jgi:midasin (ATPase involved in ribosome maturation)